MLENDIYKCDICDKIVIQRGELNRLSLSSYPSVGLLGASQALVPGCWASELASESTGELVKDMELRMPLLEILVLQVHMSWDLVFLPVYPMGSHI